MTANECFVLVYINNFISLPVFFSHVSIWESTLVVIYYFFCVVKSADVLLFIYWKSFLLKSNDHKNYRLIHSDFITKIWIRVLFLRYFWYILHGTVVSVIKMRRQKCLYHPKNIDYHEASYPNSINWIYLRISMMMMALNFTVTLESR